MLTLACSFPPQVSELGLLRAVLRPYLESLGLSPVGCEDLLLVATELAANAIEADIGNHEIRFRIANSAAAVILELEDEGPGFELPTGVESPDAEQTRGRGLWLVRALTNDVSVERTDGRTVVRAVRRAEDGREGVSSIRGDLGGL
jgi:anti-sigma regulatory factor (Ser/Thr protein kinase)